MSPVDDTLLSIATRQAASRATGDATNRSRGRILIADSDPASRRVLETMLRRLDYACDSAANGERAFERYLAFRPDVVIVDSTMPGVDSGELCRRIRESSGGAGCYVISIAGRGEYDSALAGTRRRVDDYLTKPLHRGELESRLTAARRIAPFDSVVTARRDPLTGLGNRLALSEDLAALDGRTRRYGHSYCIARCSLDGDRRKGRLGADVARDEVLSAVARALRGECRSADLAYRPGGEDIVVILPNRTPRGAGLVLERMRCAVQALAIPDAENHRALVTLSAGLATRGTARAESSGGVLARASAALEGAKARGGNCVLIGTDAITGAADRVPASRACGARRFTPAETVPDPGPCEG